MEQEWISDEIEHVEHYLRQLFQVPVGVCIADTQDVVRGTLGYEIADMLRAPRPHCVTAFEYLARIEWASSNSADGWRLMYALYRREVEQPFRGSKAVEEAERRPLLEMPIEVQRYAHRYLAQLIAAAGGEWQPLRRMMVTARRAH